MKIILGLDGKHMGDGLKWAAEQDQLERERRAWEREHPLEARRNKIITLGQKIALKKEALNNLKKELQALEAELDRIIG